MASRLRVQPDVLECERRLSTSPALHRQTFDQFTGDFDIFLAGHEDQNVSYGVKSMSAFVRTMTINVPSPAPKWI